MIPAQIDINKTLKSFENTTANEKRQISEKIDEERRFISVLESDLSEKNKNILQLEEKIRKFEDELNQIKNRITFSQEQFISLSHSKKNLEIIGAEKLKKLDETVEKAKKIKAQGEKILEPYRDKWEKYYKIYEKAPNVQAYLKLKSEVLSAQEELNMLENTKKEVEKQIKNQTRKNAKEMIEIIVEIAKLKCNTNELQTQLARDEQMNNKSITPESRARDSGTKVPRVFEKTGRNSTAAPTHVTFTSPFANIDDFRKTRLDLFGFRPKTKQTEDEITEIFSKPTNQTNKFNEIFTKKTFNLDLTKLLPSKIPTTPKTKTFSTLPFQTNNTFNANNSDFTTTRQCEQEKQTEKVELQRQTEDIQPQQHEIQPKFPLHEKQQEDPFESKLNAHSTVLSPTTLKNFEFNFSEQSSFNPGLSHFGSDVSSQNNNHPPPASSPAPFFKFLPEDDSPTSPNNNNTFKLFD